VYEIRQALIAQAAGADYVAPYLGRIADGIRATFPQINPSETFDDLSPEEYQRELDKAAMESALDAVTAMQAAVTATGSQMRVLVASIRNASDMATLAARVSLRVTTAGKKSLLCMTAG
jgi:transaldolase